MSYKQETITPYNSGEEKRQQVERMFDHIAPTYDTLNHRLSFGIDHLWRRHAIAQLKAHSPKRILDIATGTGDFALLSALRLKPELVSATDISEGMMDMGREKARQAGVDGVVVFERQDCEQLTYPADSYDAVTAAFGIRNFQHLDKSLKEMYRVLRPGGVACLLELSRPVSFPMRQLFWLYAHTLLPVYGRLVSHDASAYSYLISTIEAFPQGEQMKDILLRAGFSEAHFRRLTFGVCTCYIAIK